MLLKYIVLTCGSKLQNERTSSSIYHLLTGRRSIQTTLDAFIYQLHPYYGIYKTFKRHDFDLYIQSLREKGFLQKEVELIQMTKEAYNWLDNQYTLKKEAFFKGHLYHSFQHIFYSRLLLMIQVWTNQQMKNRHYYPIIDDYFIEQWVKRYYAQTKLVTADYLHSIYQELTRILQTVSDRQANIFVDRITGYSEFGLSVNQLAKKYRLSYHDIHIHLTSVINKIIFISHQNTKQYPQLNAFFTDLFMKHRLAKSSERTYHLLQKGLSPEHIAQNRQLSINTIYDHIVEIALHTDGFPYEQYVTIEQIKRVLTIVRQTKTFRLKEIKKYISEPITYFQIRLILTQLKKGR